MKYLKNFEYKSDYYVYLDESKMPDEEAYEYPNISFVERDDMHEIETEANETVYHSYKDTPLTFQIVGDRDYVEGDTYTIQLNFDGEDTSYQRDVQYRINYGEWIYAEFGTNSITGLTPGDTVQFYSEDTEPYTSLDESSLECHNYFGCDTKFNIFGNINSLIDYRTDWFDKLQFCYLFYDCTGLLSAEKLILPEETLSEACYASMFKGCTNLTVAPKLPSTTLADYCYREMFSGCTSLTTAPELPATALVGWCYASMFSGCINLTTAPALPATTLHSACYDHMFDGCTSLRTAPNLPATTMYYSCYRGMFVGCTSLTTAPELPATTLATYCYGDMFYGCTSLAAAPELNATAVTVQCYMRMFYNCKNLTEAPELPATNLVEYCYYQMFLGCTKLKYIKCLATNISANNSHLYWLSGVASTGTFVKPLSMTAWPTGTSGIPTGWTVQDI